MGSMYEHVFKPIRIRGIDFKNRIVLAPPSPNRGSPDGTFTHELVDFMRMFARGGVTTLYLGNASIDINECKDEECQLDLGHPTSLLSLSWYAEMAAAFGCHASLEINHNGKDTPFETTGHPPYSASAIITSSERTRAKMLGRDPIPAIEMTKEKIKETIDKFANAALLMKRAGMDIVLVHGGHGNLISQFTSPMYNLRTDEYGGSTEKRARFAIEVCDAIREKCGENFVIEFRISADEIAEEGMHFDETLELIGLLKPHIDIIHVSAGIHSDFNMAYYRNWCQNYLMPRGFNVHYAREVKKAYPDLLVTTVGSIVSIDMAEEILANGWADFVAMCRPLIADPDMPRKYAANRPLDRRPCLRCDQCARFMPTKIVNCAVNPFAGLSLELKEGTVPEAKVKKKVGIVGGGPGGVYAMMAAADRGHEVILYEKSDRLGGNLIGAASPPAKIDMKDYLAWFTREAGKYNATIKLNTEATRGMLELENFDALVIAVGAEPVFPKLPGIDKPHVHWAADAEVGKCKVGDKIVIIGAGSIGLEAALDFADNGKENIQVVEIADADTARMNLYKSSRHGGEEILSLIAEKNIPVHYNTRLDEVLDDKIVCTGPDGKKVEIEADTVLVAIGMRPRYELVEELRHAAPEASVYIVGDAKEVARITEATNAGFQVGVYL